MNFKNQKPDTSCAKKTRHFNLLTTGLIHTVDCKSAPEYKPDSSLERWLIPSQAPFLLASKRRVLSPQLDIYYVSSASVPSAQELINEPTASSISFHSRQAEQR